MAMLRVEVLRRAPRDRSSIQNLAGRMRITLTSLQYLHVGSGKELRIEKSEVAEILKRVRDPNLIKSEMQRRIQHLSAFSSINDVLVIPGSTVKGNVRSRLELSFKNVNGKVYSCFLKAGVLRSEPLKGMHGWRHYRLWRDRIGEDRGPPCDFTRSESVCLICDLFGTNGLRGLVEFSDLTLEHGGKEVLDLPYNMRLEAVKPGSAFKGSINFFNIMPEELGLILIGMGLTDKRSGKPVLLGRLKYVKEIGGRRFGRVIYTVESLELSKYSRPLDIDGSILLEPGQNVSGERLDKIISRLTSYALQRYPGLEVINEVEALERVT